MATFFIVVCGAFAALLVVLAIGAAVQASRTREWAPVPGRVRHCGIVIELVQGEATPGDHEACERTFRPWVTYEYVVDGTTHVGSLVSLGNAHASGSDANALRIVARYPEGAAVTVFHDRRDASKCVLEPGASRAFVGGMVAMLVLAALFVGIAVLVATSPPSLP